jgi:Tfp pilus assembly protein PilN
MTTTIDTPVLASAPAAADPPRSAESASPARSALAGPPRVDLLPQAIRIRRRQKQQRRLLRLVAAGVAVLTVGGVAATLLFSLTAQGSLAAAQQETLSLLAQQAKYADVKAAQERIALGQAAQAVGAGTEVDWSGYLGKVRGSLPAGVTLTSVTVDSAAPTAVFEQATAPLQGPRIATLAFTASSRQLPNAPAWIDALSALPAFVDATLDSVTRDESGVYVVDVTMHIGADAYSGRFAPQNGASK